MRRDIPVGHLVVFRRLAFRNKPMTTTPFTVHESGYFVLLVSRQHAKWPVRCRLLGRYVESQRRTRSLPAESDVGDIAAFRQIHFEQHVAAPRTDGTAIDHASGQCAAFEAQRFKSRRE